jgi:hypothetical protein
MEKFDAVAIEYAFAQLMGLGTGARGLANDADVFRHGDPKDLGALLQQASAALAQRIGSLRFDDAEKENGGAFSRLEVAAAQLQRLGKDLEKRSKAESEDPHWEVIGALVATVAALLEHCERREG